MERNVKIAVFLLPCLVASLFFNAYQLYLSNRPVESHSPTFFSFVFGPTMQNITEGNLYLNLTFDVLNENLTVKAEVNAESYNPDAYLALQFDSDNNGTIDVRYYVYYFWEDDSQFLLRVNNMTRPGWFLYWGWYPDGTIYLGGGFSEFYEHKSPFHYCTYSNGIYTFYFSFPTEPTSHAGEHDAGIWWLTGKYGVQGKLVRVLYGILPFDGWPEKGMTVYVPPFKFME